MPKDAQTSLRAVLMGTKSCTKISNFSTRFSCENLAVEDFVKRSLWGKKLVDGEILCLGMISEYLYMLFFAGDTKFKLEMATYFFLTRGLRFARADKAVALQYHSL